MSRDMTGFEVPVVEEDVLAEGSDRVREGTPVEVAVASSGSSAVVVFGVGVAAEAEGFVTMRLMTAPS